MRKRIRQVVLAAFLLALVNALVACRAVRPTDDGCSDGSCEPEASVRLRAHPRPIANTLLQPHIIKHPSMHALAHDLDHLERHIDIYGSVTAKGPDIWGEARLTRDREAIDIQLSSDMDKFAVRLQGKLTRSDQAFLESATALSILAAPKSAGSVAAALKSGPTYLAAPLVETGRTQTTKHFDSKGNVVLQEEKVLGLAEVATETPAAATPQTPAVPPAAAAQSLITDSAKVTRTTIPTRVIPVIGGNVLDGDAIGIEPTLFLNQKKRYLDYLTQLRRQNEGDDTADSPGYAMNLFRIPVSVLPGKRTDTGHGAEVTFTLTPALSDELLPTTFRTLATNDLVNQLGFPLVQLLDPRGGQVDLLSDENRVAIRHLEVLSEITKHWLAGQSHLIDAEIAKLPMSLQIELVKEEVEIQLRELDNFRKPMPLIFGEETAERFKDLQTDIEGAIAGSKGAGLNYLKALRSLVIRANTLGIQFNNVVIGESLIRGQKRTLATNAAQGRSANRYTTLTARLTKLNSFTVPFSTGTRGRQAIPFSQYVEVFGGKFLFEVGYRGRRAMADSFKQQGYAHLPDVQGFLRMEIDAAYRALKDKTSNLFNDYCTQDLVRWVHNRDYKQLEILREAFRTAWIQQLHPNHNHTNKENPEEQPEYSSSAALAWMLIVQSALLNDRLIQDMKETAAAKNKALPNCGEWPHYFLPDPCAEVRLAFKEYVGLRWPIHVFALDPATDEQNIADSLTLQRESQFALSLAFTSGRINANQFTRFARRLESQYDTIALNRTQIGFSHGDNIFGWRFTPRFQSPPTQGNLKTIVRDQLLGAPIHPSSTRKLEVGPRECVALVIMPSFVPYVNVEVASNWFCLDNPKHVLINHVRAMNLSETVQAIRTQQCAIGDSERYREGDLGRLVNRAEQLSARLPLQSMTAQVPVQTTLGGFEMFVNGTTDLAPELSGWYGAPGIDPNNETTLFLVGDHFSVTQSKVLAGNRPVASTMISRQVMQVTVPAGVMPTKNDCVQVNVATPYGVSQDLLVPYVKPPKPPVAASATLPNSATIVYQKKGDGKGEGKYNLEFADVKGQAGAFVQWPADAGPVPTLANLAFTFMYNDCPIAIRVDGLIPIGTQFHLNKAHLEDITRQLFKSLNPFGPFDAKTNPLNVPFTSAKIVIIPVLPDPNADRKPSANQIELKFECSIK